MYAPTHTWRKWHRKINVTQRRFATASALAASAIPALVMARGHRVEQVAEIVGFSGRVVWDDSMPDGTPRKLLSVERLRSTGWRATTDLATGLADTYRWYRENIEGARH